MKEQLPKGIYIHGTKLYYVFRDKLTKKVKNINTHLPATKQGIRDSRKWIEEFNNVKGKSIVEEKRLVKLNKAVRLSDAVKEYICSKNDISESSKSLYHYAVKNFIEVNGDMYLSAYQKNHTDKLIQSWEKSEHTLDIILRHLSVIFNYFVKNKTIPEHYIYRKSVTHKLPKSIPDSELMLMFDYLKEKNINGYNLIKFLYLSGLRISEALIIKWSDINYENNIIEITNIKAKRTDYIPISSQLREHLLTINKNDGNDKIFIYTDRNLKFYFRMQIDLFQERKYTIHQLRKSFISKLANGGLSILDIKALARHKDIRTTLLHYASTDLNRIKTDLDNKVKF